MTLSSALLATGREESPGGQLHAVRHGSRRHRALLRGLRRDDRAGAATDADIAWPGYTVLIVGALVGAVTAAIAALTVRHLTRLDHPTDASVPGWR